MQYRHFAAGVWACELLLYYCVNSLQWFGQSTLEWQDGSSINRFSTWVAGKLAWIGVQWALGPRWDLDRIAATVLVLVLVPPLVQLGGNCPGVLWEGCRCAGVCGVVLEKIPYAPRPVGLAHGGNRRNRNLSPVRPQRIG